MTLSLPPAPTLLDLGPPSNDLAPLATVLAHRLRSLVASIQGCAELLTDTLDGEDRDLALHILEGGAAIERVLADLLCYGHRPTPTLFPLPVAPFAAGLLEALGAGAERVALSVDLPPDYRHAADPVLLRQTLLILLQNAFEAAPPESTVDLRFLADGGSLTVEVRNDGAVEDPDRMFEPFFTTKTDRLGLGLAIARRAAEDHRGTLTAAADRDAGTVVVSLRLPAPLTRVPRRPLSPPSHAEPGPVR